MSYWEAIQNRHSVRSYTDQLIEPQKAEKLQKVIHDINTQTGLHIQLKLQEPNGFSGMMARYGSFDGVRNYIVMAGPKNADRAIGYYGEQIVLTAQMLGLNTCWVALTFNKGKAIYNLEKGEKLYCVISLGYGKTQGVPHKSKPAKAISDLSEDSPEWYKNGIDAVLLAPTAVNQQKFYFSLEGNTVSAKAGSGFYTELDLGIAQCHFDIGSGRNNFSME